MNPRVNSDDTDADKAYRRLQPGITRDDPVFRAKVAEFQARIDDADDDDDNDNNDPRQTLRSIIDTAGFTPVERQLLVAVRNNGNPHVAVLQRIQRWWYHHYRLQQQQQRQQQQQQHHSSGERYYYCEPPAYQLALCWFGANFCPLELDDDGRIITATTESSDGYIDAGDDGNALQFLDKYDDTPVYARPEDSYDNLYRAARSQNLYRAARSQTRYRLRGGGTSTGTGTTSTTSTAPSKTIWLHGFQGAVQFDIYRQDSLSDAVARLLGPTQNINVAIYSLGPALNNGKGQGKATAHYPPKVYPAGPAYDFHDIQQWFAGDGAEDRWALFVCAIDETPPARQWQPGDGDTLVVHCTRADDDGSDSQKHAVAYLRRPANARALAPNQYGDWMLVVARILTPGAGLDALNNKTAGVLARCLFGLHRSSSLTTTTTTTTTTPAGLGFAPSSWAALVDDGSGARETQQPVRATAMFDVAPLQDGEICIYMAGGSRQPIIINTNNSKTAAQTQQPYFNDTLAHAIDGLLQAALAPDELGQLESVDVWPDGRFWQNDERPITVPLLGQGQDRLSRLISGFRDPRVLEALQSYYVVDHVPAAVVAVRPIFASYTAVLVCSHSHQSSQKINFGSHDTLAEFRGRLREAAVAGLDPDRDAFWIHQAAPPAQTDRPSFYIGPDENNWQLVRGQIVSPVIWLEHAPAVPGPTAPTASTVWGFREAYGNMLDLDARAVHDRRLDELGWQKENDGQGVLTGVLHRKAIIQRTLAYADTDDSIPPRLPAVTNVSSSSSSRLFPLTYQASMLTPSETARLTRAFEDLYGIALRRPLPCPHAGCGKVFGGRDTTTTDHRSCSSAGEFITHCEEHLLDAATKTKTSSAPHVASGTGGVTACALCEAVFAAGTADADKLQHLICAHDLLRAVPDEVETADAQNDKETTASGSGAQQTGLATPPGSAAKRSRDSAAKRKRRDSSSSGRTSNENQNSTGDTASRAVSRSAKSKSKRRKTAEKDSLYRPQADTDETDDDDDDDDDDDSSVESSTKKSRPKKRKRAADPSYRPGEEGEDDDDEKDAPDGTPQKSSSKKKKTGLDDPSFRPAEPPALLYIDDQDEELRRSAVPEWEWDPTDPTGKRKRVIREKSAGVAKGNGSRRSTSRAGTPSRSAPRGTTPRGTPPPGRGRQPSQKPERPARG